MKNLKRYSLALLLGALAFTSCESFLEEENKSAVSAGFYDTEAGVQAALNSCYDVTRYWYYREEPIQIIEGGTDLFTRGNDNKQGMFAQYTTQLNGAAAYLTTAWNKLYQGVEWVNIALEKLETVPMSDATRKQMIGEARFLRAFFYWHIVETWGPVPMPVEPTDESNEDYKSPKKSTIADIYTQMLADLDVAIANLAGFDPKNGKANEWGAKAMKARVLLYRASEYNQQAIGSSTVSADAKAAADLAAEVIEKSGRKLYPRFRDIWDMANHNGKTNQECLWFVNYSQNMSITGNGNTATVVYIIKYDNQPGLVRSVLYNRPFNRVMVSLRALDLFDETIDQRYKGTFRDTWLTNDAKKLTEAQAGGYPNMRDTAMWMKKGVATPAEIAWADKRYQLFDYTKVYRTDDATKVGTNYDALRGIQMNKFQDSLRSSTDETRSFRDAFVFRIAEMYLIAAEGYWRAGDAANAVKYMNLLRETRAIPGKESEMRIAAGNLTLDFFLDENGREFIGEVHRWFDLKRTKKLVEYNNKWNADAEGRVQEFHMLRPIPQSMLDAVRNKDEFTQNPGYGG